METTDRSEDGVTTVAVVAPAPSQGGIGQYAATLGDRFDERDEVTTVRHAVDETRSVREHIAAAWAATAADVVHLHFEYGLFRPKLLLAWPFMTVLLLGRLLRGTSVVVTVHEVWTPVTVGRVQYTYVWLVHSLLAMTATLVVFMTDETAADFRAAVVGATTRIQHGVPYTDIHTVDPATARETFNYDPEDTVVAQIGYVSKRKGTDTVLSLAERMPETQFLIAGGARRQEDESYVGEVMTAARENVQVTGVLDDKAFHHAFVAADVAVLAYRDIRQSGILNWCFAYGLPAVCRSIPRFEAVADDCAGVVLFGRDRSIDDAVTMALEERATRSSAMTAYAEANDMTAVAAAYVAVFEGSLSGQRSKVSQG